MSAVVRVSLAELASTGILLHPGDAAAIVRCMCRRYARGELRGIPSTLVIRLTQDGQIAAEGPVEPDESDQATIVRAAQLLHDLLPVVDAPAPHRVPGGLRLIVSRALGTMDLPAFASLDEFCDALERFAAPDLAAAVRCLFRSWQAIRGPRVLTISDIRRARRATGLSLADISAASGIDVTLLRELEWGYLRNWRADEEGRKALGRYARAAGLDEPLVQSVAWPLIKEAALQAPELTADASSQALVLAPPQTLVPYDASRGSPGWASPRLLGAAGAILLLIALTYGFWRPLRAPAAARAEGAAAAPARNAAPASAAMSAVANRRAARPAKTERPAMRRPAAAPRHPPVRKASFFKRELFRIVIR